MLKNGKDVTQSLSWPGRRSCNTALASAGDAWCWLAALRLLHSELRGTGVRADIVTCSAAASAATSARQWCEALDVVAQACRRGMQLDLVAYGGQLVAFEQGARWNDALLTLHSVHLQLQPDAVLLRGALSAVASGWHWQRAIDRHCLQDKGDNIALETAARACQAAGSWRVALRLFSVCEDLGLAVIALEAIEKSDSAPPLLPALLAAANPVAGAGADRAKVAYAMQLLESHDTLSAEAVQIFLRKKIQQKLQKLANPTQTSKSIVTKIRDTLLKSYISLGAIAEQRSLTSLGFTGCVGVQISPIATWSTRAQLHAEVLGSVREQGQSDAQEELIASFLPCWAAVLLVDRGYRGRVQGLGTSQEAPYFCLLPVAAHHNRGRHAERQA